MRTPIMTRVTFPNLLMLGLRGASAYMEAVVRHITTPRLEKLEINFPNQLTFSVPAVYEHNRESQVQPCRVPVL